MQVDSRESRVIINLRKEALYYAFSILSNSHIPKVRFAFSHQYISHFHISIFRIIIPVSFAFSHRYNSHFHIGIFRFFTSLKFAFSHRYLSLFHIAKIRIFTSVSFAFSHRYNTPFFSTILSFDSF